MSCGYNSDTFDSILDLSIDIHGAFSVQQALKKFVAIDSLKGADKYKCDKYVVPRFTFRWLPSLTALDSQMQASCRCRETLHDPRSPCGPHRTPQTLLPPG